MTDSVIPSTAETSLEEYRASKAPVEAQPVVADPLTVVMPEGDEPAEAPEEPEASETPETPPAPPQAATPEVPDHRWKDPETGVKLDLRRRDHRKIKQALEERAELRAQRQVPPRPEPTAPERPARPQLRPPVDPKDPEPQLDSFANETDPYAAYVAASARWNARQELRHQQAQRAIVERAQRQTADVQQWQSAFDAKRPAVKAQHPDFDAVEAALMAALPTDGRARPLVHRLLTAPNGHELTYYLGTHLDELQTLYEATTESDHHRAIGRVEARVEAQTSAPTPAPSSPPPTPMTPTGGSGTPTTYDIKTASLAQYRAHKKRAS